MKTLSIRRLVPPPARLGEFSPLLVSLVVTMISVQVLEAHRLASSIPILIEDNIRYPFVGEFAYRVNESHGCVLRMKSDRSLVASHRTNILLQS